MALSGDLVVELFHSALEGNGRKYSEVVAKIADIEEEAYQMCSVF